MLPFGGTIAPVMILFGGKTRIIQNSDEPNEYIAEF